MSIEHYGVLKGMVLGGKEERNLKKPHYQIHVKGEDNKEYRVAVNVMSRPIHPEVLYLAEEDFYSSILSALASLPFGFTPITNSNSEIALDYIRGDIIPKPYLMKPLSHDLEGNDNDLNDFLQKYVQLAVQEKNPPSTIYVFGSKFISYGVRDEVFHFSPPVGIHNVHMNQGNDRNGQWTEDNGIWQDGGILIQMGDQWIAIFLAFLTQSWCTDADGHATEVCSYKQTNKIKKNK